MFGTSKYCHNSDLKITKCMPVKSSVEAGVLKTSWKRWNSTEKTGVKTELLNFIHRVFNLWKKEGLFTGCIRHFCGKLSLLVKQTDKRENRGQHKPQRGTKRGFYRNSGKKNAFVYGKESRLMLYFKMI